VKLNSKKRVVDWINVLQHTDQWRAIMNTVINNLEMIMTMVYAVQNYWAYKIYPSYSVQKQEIEEHNVSETGPVSSD
jgi:hypothetical protein